MGGQGVRVFLYGLLQFLPPGTALGSFPDFTTELTKCKWKDEANPFILKWLLLIVLITETERQLRPRLSISPVSDRNGHLRKKRERVNA